MYVTKVTSTDGKIVMYDTLYHKATLDNLQTLCGQSAEGMYKNITDDMIGHWWTYCLECWKKEQR